MNEYMNDDFWIRLTDKVISYGTGRYNIKRVKRLSTKAIKAYFYGLSPSLREILILRYHKKKTLAAIGQELGMTPQGVRFHELKAYDAILKSALFTSLAVPVLRKPSKNKTVSTDDLDGDKSVLNEMALIDKVCCDSRQIKNVLTELSPRIIGQLEKCGFRTMEQLCCTTPNNLKNIYGIGDVALRKIQQAVKSFRAQNPRSFLQENVTYSVPREKTSCPPKLKGFFRKK